MQAGPELLAQARRLHGEKRLAEAEAAYLALLRTDPDEPRALAGLGLLRAALGQRTAAIDLLRRACAVAPTQAETHNQLGGLLLAWHQPQAALDCFTTALSLAPNAAEAHYNHAQALAALGRQDEAAASYRAALARAPGLGRAHARLAQLLLMRGEAEAALPHFGQATAHGAATPSLRNDHGAALAALGRHQEAIDIFQAITTPAEEFAAAQNNLGNALMALKREAEAEAAFRTAIGVDPDFALAHGNLGNALLELGRAGEALTQFDRALALDARQAEYHNGRGKTLVLLGGIAAARDAFAEAVALAPSRAAYYAGLASVETLGADDPRFIALTEMARTPADAANAALAHFALFRAYDAQGKTELAFAHLCEGNRLRRPDFPYHEAQALRLMERIKGVFSPALLSRAARPCSPPDLPIFILGMPRSGSTLVEQIIASHRSVSAGGELRHMVETSVALGRVASAGLPYPENIIARTDSEFAAAGAAYRARLQAEAPTARRITDKMPANFHHVGLIRRILPGAKIIHTRRDPVDTCFSCFAQTFNEGQPFANDLGDLARYYKAYAQLMTHWRAVLPAGAMLEVDYEALVTDFEPQVRRILDYCELDWDPACLEFYALQRPVHTASAAQVRQQLYQHAAGRAKAYGSLLDPLRAALAGGDLM